MDLPIPGVLGGYLMKNYNFYTFQKHPKGFMSRGDFLNYFMKIIVFSQKNPLNSTTL